MDQLLPDSEMVEFENELADLLSRYELDIHCSTPESVLTQMIVLNLGMVAFLKEVTPVGTRMH